ncbi:hypothetical protein GCG21_05450 [Pseudactinotalea sp. HY160]|uniref:FKBP-type peptidyl-prolyl cis-trans isomerase n=1 Tax=Pseudactinotalea sp. HY160 TaxID=2654490 RepID=UPI00128AE228|nr:hypothetical protein [Pseudactinotalea sp. HY160]
MNRTLRRLLPVLFSAALVVTACSTGSGESAGESDSPTGDGTSTADASSEIGDGTGVAMPEVSGDFGDAPEFTWPDGDPDANLQVQVLSEGDGSQVEAQSVVAANYAGYVWGSDTAFDSSFARGGSTGFSLNRVIQGWSQGIPGHTVGSRLLITVPPSLGYGENGNPQAGIGGTDTIVFVVDIVAAYGPEQFGDPDAAAVADEADLPVTVEGAPGKPFTVTIPEGAEVPTDSRMIQLTEGTGETIEAGRTVVVTYSRTDWETGQGLGSWQEETGPGRGPATVQVGAGDLWDDVVGMTVGSRILVIEPATEQAPAMAMVADLIGVV